ncbi:MAG TPA: flagellar basal body rod protein FlgC [Firmicutes bacterium]|jgi:flagellar basal-body rod protein FlgC|nr:flagellar basal body rod protein FlgC [Bacillota bacterium]
MELLPAMSIAASGLTAERMRLDIIANNLANVHTTRTAAGGPYRRQVPVFAERLQEALRREQAPGLGVQVAAIVQDATPPQLIYDPAHPDANGEGYVAMPNVNVVMEMVDMITATRAYEANVTVLNAAKAMTLQALQIGR